MITVEQFFKKYAKASLGNDPSAIASFYSDEFIAADPSGSKAYKNDGNFLKWLKNIAEFNRQSGMRDMNVLDVDATPLGNEYLSAKVSWGCYFEKTGHNVISFEITYVLRKTGESYQIILYVSHESQELLMKEYGLIQDS